MAPSMVKSRWILYIFVAVVFIYLFNKVIVMHYFDAVQRARALRFQLSCFIQGISLLASLYVWAELSTRLDQNKPPTSHSLIDFKRIWKLFEPQNIVGRRFSLPSNIWRIVLLIILVSMQCTYSTFNFFISNSPHPHALAIWIFLCFALFIQLITGVVIDKTLTFIVKCCFKGNNKIQSLFRNDKLKGVIIVTYAVTLVSIGHYNSLFPPEIKEETLRVRDLPTKLNGLTITFVSDIHLGPTVGRRKLEQVVHMVNYLGSDLVIIGGDLVDGRVDQLGESTESVEWIKSKYGTYFVTGNHEYYTTDAHTWVKHLESLGVHVLRNNNVRLPASADSDERICLAGVDDPMGNSYKFLDHGMDVEKALKSCDQRYPVILVSHNPQGAKLAMESKHRVDLALAGHTHGGQMFPLIIGAYLFNPYYAGLYPHGDHSYVYVSMGTVYWGIPVRFGTTPEITKITLVTTT